MRKILLTIMTVMTTLAAVADNFTTAGDGTTWTMTRLAQTDGTGVTVDEKTFTMASNVVIAAGDAFKIEEGITVRMGDRVTLRIEGEADFAADDRVLFTAIDETVQPYGIYMQNDTKRATFRNIDFEYAGLKNFSTAGADIADCSFTRHNGISGTSALSMGTNGASFTISGCTFTECAKSAIGGAANYLNPVTITGCTFTANGTANANTPQLNITTAENVTIKDCVIVGAPEHTKVGGIVVSNLVNLTGELNTLIENCEIRNNRFGVATYCEQTATIRNNVIVSNKYETNAMNGGSGINIYDPYMTQTITVTGNYIEDNLWGITVIGGRNVNIGKTEDPTADDYNPGLNVFLNNGNGGVTYDLYNNSANTVYAQGNYWKSVASQDQESIETVVFHKNDNPALGEVIFMPALDSDPSGISHAPTALPQNVKAEYYTLDGRRLGSLNAAGRGTICIVKANENGCTVVSKVVVR